MGAFVSSMLGSAVVLAVMYLVYRWAISGTSDHGFNRGVLIAIYLLAFAVCPLWDSLSFPLPGGDVALGLPAADDAVVSDVFEVIIEAPGVMTEPAVPMWPLVLVGIYLAGAAVVATFAVRDYVMLRRLVRSGERSEHDGYTLVLVDRDGLAPMSWGRTIVMSRADHEAYGGMILAHERHHIAAGHRYDLMLAQAVIILNWFNPAAWLMRDELRAVHEYQADMAVLGSGASEREYQLLLIAKSAGYRISSLANSLNHSKIKRRITMMLTHDRASRRRWRTMAIVPAVALSLVMLDTPAVASVLGSLDGARLPEGEPENPVAAAPAEELPGLLIARPVKELAEAVTSSAPVTAEASGPSAPTRPKVSESADSMEYYVNGMKVSLSIVNAISPHAIAGVDVDKEGKRVSLTLREDGEWSGNEPIKVIGYGTREKRAVRRKMQFGSGSVQRLAATPEGEVTIFWANPERQPSVVTAGKPEYYIDGAKADVEAVLRLPADSVTGLDTGNDRGMNITTASSRGASPIRRIDLDPAEVKEVYIDGVKANIRAVRTLDPSLIRDVTVADSATVHLNTRK